VNPRSKICIKDLDWNMRFLGMRFLGMVNYLSSYIPNKSEITRPLRELLKEDCVWHWGEAQDKAVQNLKQILYTEPVLYMTVTNKHIKCE
jgi:hypothetical protein